MSLHGGWHTLAFHVSINVEFRDMILWRSLDPDALPNSTTGSVEDMTGPVSLLSNGNYIITIVCGIVHKDKTKSSQFRSN